MSKKGSNKESIFTIYLKDFYQQWQEILGFELNNISLEQNHTNRTYMERIKKMMLANQEAVIVWMALSFDEVILRDLTDWIKSKQLHYIDFFAVSINPLAIDMLEKLNQMYKLEVYEHMKQLIKIRQLLTVDYSIKNIHPLHAGHALTLEPPLDLSRTDDIKRAMLAVLRKRMPFYLNFHYNKKMNLNDLTLTVGSGQNGLLFRCSSKNVKSRAFVELYFEKHRIDRYRLFLKHRELIRNEVHPDIQFEHRKIGVYFKPLDSLEDTFDMIAEIFEKFILYFCPYTYGRKEIAYVADQWVKSRKD
ncbi:hypothetical protein [Ureibacillus manganicus]|uniref:Uncharacterized protein n=1 Tax=Ureibacillus manganicus DSM 26584 TaxID=1384049 RepID=A0A0A3I550_9BACL|nr:hypothetical protein [Ureibacillus manganicus]KGR79849.1 hypothetical protein CD29_04785 [Ureibacillus manganicus DSM 26584]